MKSDSSGMDQLEVSQANNQMRRECAAMMAEIKSKGGNPPSPPLETRDALLDFSQLQTYRETLCKAVGRTPAANAATRAAPRAAALPVQSAAAPTAKPAGAKKLTMTEQILAAKGCRTLEELRAKRQTQPCLD
jgi:hypothetical protein